jgi:hypothetical protein
MELFQHIEGFIDSKIKVAKTFLLLIKLEAKLAGLSIFPLLLNLCMVFIILLTLWLTVMALLGMTILVFIGNSFVALFLVLVVNFVLLFFLNHYIKENLRRMSFEKTRESLRRSDEHAINKTVE